MEKFKEKIEESEKLIRENKYLEAKKILEDMFTKGIEDGRAYQNYGNILLVKHKEKEAIVYYEKALKIGYVDYKLLVNLCTAYRMSGQEKSSLKLLEENADSFFEKKEVYQRAKADVLFFTGKWDEAQEVYKSLGRDGREGLLTIALSYLSKKKYNEMLELLQQVLQMPYKDKVYYSVLYLQAFIKRKIDIRIGEKEYQETLEILLTDFENKGENGENIYLGMFIVLCYRDIGWYGKAYRYLEYLENKFADIPEIQEMKAQLLYEARRNMPEMMENMEKKNETKEKISLEQVIAEGKESGYYKQLQEFARFLQYCEVKEKEEG